MRISVNLFWLLIVVTGCSPSNKNGEGLSSQNNDLPTVSLVTTKGDTVRANGLPGKTILIFFVPDCDHCQRQAEAVQHELDTFKEYSLYFIASNPVSELSEFAGRYHLNGYINVIFAHAETEEVIRALGPMAVPTIYIYSAEKRLVRKFDRETQVDELAKYL